MNLAERKQTKKLKPRIGELPFGKQMPSLMEIFACTTRKWFKCKKLWGAGHISAFWVSKGLLRIKLSNEYVSLITHDCDLKKLFPGNPSIEDN